jgi:hypothetical protein
VTSLGEGMRDDAFWPRGEESSGALSEEESVICVKGPGFFPERPSALERFKRRVQEIARAAEITARGPVAARNAGEEARKHRRYSCFGMEPQTVSPETRDSVPFGLKRRVAVGFPIFEDRQHDGRVTLSASGEGGPRVALDRGVRVQGKLVRDEPRGHVLERSRGGRDRLLPEEAHLRQLRRAVKQVALDLLAEMMEIDAVLQQARTAHGVGRR